MRPRAYLTGIAVALVTSALAGAFLYGMSGWDRDAAPVRKARPDLSGTTLDGRAFSLAELRGHLVLVTVWASWCGPCRAEFPLLTGLADRLGPKGLRVVGVDVRDSAESAADFLRESGGRAFPHLMDRDGRLALELGALGVPETYLVDRDGRVAERAIGPVTQEWIDRHVLPRLTP